MQQIIESLENRVLFCGSTTTSDMTTPTASSALIVQKTKPQIPNVVGDYAGNSISKDGTQPIDINITSQTGKKFTATVSNSDFTATFTGTIDNKGKFSGKFTTTSSNGGGGTTKMSATVSGQITGNTLAAKYSSSQKDSKGHTKHVSGTISATRQ